MKVLVEDDLFGYDDTAKLLFARVEGSGSVSLGDRYRVPKQYIPSGYWQKDEGICGDSAESVVLYTAQIAARRPTTCRDPNDRAGPELPHGVPTVTEKSSAMMEKTWTGEVTLYTYGRKAVEVAYENEMAWIPHSQIRGGLTFPPGEAQRKPRDPDVHIGDDFELTITQWLANQEGWA